MKLEKVRISPAIAQEYLKKNTVNRRVDKDRVDAYAKDIIQGKWFQETSETIKFSKDRLIDGQHRLHAIVKSGKTVELLVAFDIPQEAFAFIDQGKTRNAADVLFIDGVKNSTAIAGLIRYYHELVLGNGGRSEMFKRQSNETILKLYTDRPDFWQTLLRSCQKYYSASFKSVSTSWICGWYAYLLELIPDKTENFFNDVFINRQAFITTDRFYENIVRSKTSNTFKLGEKQKDAMFIKTINSWISKKPIKVLKYTLNEEFPVLKLNNRKKMVFQD